MKAADVEDKIVAILSTDFRVERAKVVVVTATLAGDLDLDSLDIVEFAMALEDKFGISLADDVVATWDTVGDVFDTVRAEVC